MNDIDKLLKSIRKVSSKEPVTQLQLSEIIRGLWSTKERIIQIVYEQFINNTTNIFQTINQIIGSNQEAAHDSYLIEDTTNISETVTSIWSVLPYEQQCGVFEATVTVHDKTTNTIMSARSLLSFDYSEAPEVTAQSDLITASGVVLTVGVDLSGMLYVTASAMSANPKRIHVCLKRCVLSTRTVLLSPEFNVELGMATALTSIDDLGYVDNAFDLNTSAVVNAFESFELLLEFYTNSPNTTTFDPSITASSGEYKWDVGGTEFLGNNLSTTLDGSTKLVRLYGKGDCKITSLNFGDDNIVGLLDLSNEAFQTLTNITGYLNPSLNEVIFSENQTGILSYLNFGGCGLNKTLDISKFLNLSPYTTIVLDNTNLLTNVIFPVGYSGLIGFLSIQSSAINTLDLSGIVNLTEGAAILISGPITNLVLPNINSGSLGQFTIEETNLSGELDISMITKWSNSATIRIQKNASLSDIIFPTSITGKITYLYLDENSLGYITMPANWWSATVNSSGAIYLRNNNMSASEVNHWLVSIDSVGGNTSYKIIELSGTNAAPDTTSGGYNGIAAKNSLLVKWFTLNTN